MATIFRTGRNVMNHETWYEILTSHSLLQGDILLAYPVSEVLPESDFSAKSPQVSGEIVTTDLVVMTQSCELETNKVAQVLLAQLISWPHVVRDETKRGNT